MHAHFSNLWSQTSLIRVSAGANHNHTRRFVRQVGSHLHTYMRDCDFDCDFETIIKVSLLMCKNSLSTYEGGAHDYDSVALRGSVDLSGVIVTLQ